MDWHYVKDGKGEGPVSEGAMAELERKGAINGSTLVWADGMAEWVPLDTQRGRLPVPAPEAAPASAAGASASVAAPAGHLRCDDCGKYYHPDEIFHYKGQSICPNCKPAFLRRVKEGSDAATDLPYSGFWRRVGARLIDSVMLNVAYYSTTFVASMALGKNQAVSLVLLALYMGGAAFYEIYMTGRFGATVGKMALGLKVLEEGGHPISMRTSAYRYFANILSSLTCGIGYLIMLGHPKAQCLHDRLVGTVVTRA